MPTRKVAAPMPPIPVDSAAAFRQKLHRWFRRHARDLPWRTTRDPYRILISELMLQQTQVSRVLDFYRRFLKRFPDLHALASAKPQRVLEAWEGLGYYARARNLHKLARHVTREREGIIPSAPAELRALPGVGAYTAGAVASFAYEKRAALVDTNVARVLQRVFAPTLDPKSSAGLKRLWHIAEQLLPRTGKAVWTHNQSLMELGALVCSARSPKCEVCPVSSLCASRARFTKSAEPEPRAKKRPRRAEPLPPFRR
jgi:A/G-specific adenine glycosylase